MKNIIKVISIIFAVLLVAFCAAICTKLFINNAPVVDICIGIANVLVAIAILCVIIRLCYMFRTPKVQKENHDYEYYDEYEEIEPEPVVQNVILSEMYLFANGGDCMMMVRQVQVN